MKGKEKQRIILLDLLRAFAVVMMIQGHSIHSLLNNSYSDSNSVFYQAWIFFRGVTAPLFIFTSGLIFTFLLLQNPFSFKNNPRIRKGLIKGITLILIGYLLRYPTINIFKLADASHEQWLTFFSVDALHLIGVGLLLILAFAYLSNFVKINLSLLFVTLGFSIFFISPYINSFGWENISIPIASYFTSKFGSIFPLFPYLSYIFLGAFFGVYFASDKSLFQKFSFLLILLSMGFAIILLTLFLSKNFGVSLYFSSLMNIGVLLIIFSTFGLIFRNINSLPHYLQSLARNSLWIYIIHLIIIYGSPTSIGLYQIIGKTQSAEVSIISAFIMIILMTIISVGIDKLRVRKNKIF